MAARGRGREAAVATAGAQGVDAVGGDDAAVVEMGLQGRRGSVVEMASADAQQLFMAPPPESARAGRRRGGPQ